MMRPQEFQPLDTAVMPRFAEPATFLRTPYVHRYAELDIALVGVPFELGTPHRTGARHGPAQIREMSRLIQRVNAASAIAPFDLGQVADVGDAPKTRSTSTPALYEPHSHAIFPHVSEG